MISPSSLKNSVELVGYELTHEEAERLHVQGLAMGSWPMDCHLDSDSLPKPSPFSFPYIMWPFEMHSQQKLSNAQSREQSEETHQGRDLRVGMGSAGVW